MIISHKYKFIFIKTRKTAGTSLEVFLSGHCDKNDVLTPIDPPIEGHNARNYKGFYNHISAVEVRKIIDKNTWDNYFKFCVERNPWDKVLSYFFMHKARFDEKITLDEYINSEYICSDYHLYADYKDGSKIIIDTILRYEHLSEDLSDIFNKLNIPFDGSLGINAKSEYRQDRRHYSEVLNNQQTDLIRKKFQREIELLGYKYQPYQNT